MLLNYIKIFNNVKIIQHYFPNLSALQTEQLVQLESLYLDWNSKINVISRKRMDNFYEVHVLHSLSIAKWIQFKDNTKIMDLGTGGGFPGIPLAILFPNCHFLLVDSVGKKITVVNSIIETLQLKNVSAVKNRAEHISQKFDFVITRAVAKTKNLLQWSNQKINTTSFNDKSNGLIALKGGELSEELKGVKAEVINIQVYFKEDFFETKKIVFVEI